MNTEPTLDKISPLTSDALERLVFVLGTSRGGTTILHHSIGIHGEILQIPISHFMHHVWSYRDKVDDKLFGQIFTLPSFYDQEKIIQTLDEEEGAFLRRYIKESLASKNMRLMWQLYPLMYSLSREDNKDPRNIKCWLEKEGDLADLEAIRSSFPRAKFVFVVRDPRGAVGSLAQRLTSSSKGTLADGLDHLALIESCIHWRYSMQRILRFSKTHPEISLMVKFEDFLSSPEDHLNRIFQFMLVTELSKEDIGKRLRQLYYFTSNHPEDYEDARGISQEPMERWRTFLNEFEINLISAMTGRTAHKLGYRIEKSGYRSGLWRTIRNSKNFRRKLKTALKVVYVRVYELFV